jgi:TRAP-type C4-dicarboxylate transport system substrate-binding protein
MDGEIGLEIMRAMEAQGIVGLAYYDAGARSFYNTVRPITSAEDLEGLRIRVMNSDMFVATMEALGANATPMEFGQVYDALRTGVIDGAENNFPSYETTRHFEVAGFYTLDEHSLTPEILMISKQVWDGISDDDQILIRKAAALSVPYMRELWDAQEAASREAVLAAGAEIVDDIDKQPFIDAMQPVYDQFVTTPELQDLVARIRAFK